MHCIFVLLSQVLNGEKGAADILAKAVHEELPLPSLPPELLKGLAEGEGLDVSQLGVWIDPIGECKAGSPWQPFVVLC